MMKTNASVVQIGVEFFSVQFRSIKESVSGSIVNVFGIEGGFNVGWLSACQQVRKLKPGYFHKARARAASRHCGGQAAESVRFCCSWKRVAGGRASAAERRRARPSAPRPNDVTAARPPRHSLQSAIGSHSARL